MMKNAKSTTIYSVSCIAFQDEARHGKAFAGLLKRYFGK